MASGAFLGEAIRNPIQIVAPHGDYTFFRLRREKSFNAGVDEVDRRFLRDVHLWKIGECILPRGPIEAYDCARALAGEAIPNIAVLDVDVRDPEVIAVQRERALPVIRFDASRGKVAITCPIQGRRRTAWAGVGVCPSGTAIHDEPDSAALVKLGGNASASSGKVDLIASKAAMVIEIVTTHGM